MGRGTLLYEAEEGEHVPGQERQQPTHGPATGRAIVKKKGTTVATTMLLLLKLASCEEAGGGGAVTTRPLLPALRATPSAVSTTGRIAVRHTITNQDLRGHGPSLNIESFDGGADVGGRGSGSGSDTSNPKVTSPGSRNTNQLDMTSQEAPASFLTDLSHQPPDRSTHTTGGVGFLDESPRQLELFPPQVGQWETSVDRGKALGMEPAASKAPPPQAATNGHTFQIAKVLAVPPSNNRRRRLSTDVAVVSTFDALSSAITSDADINVVGDITFTGAITISGKTNVAISSSTGAVLISDRKFSVSSGGLFYVSWSDMTFTGLGFESGSASHYGGCLHASESTVEFTDIGFTSCSAFFYWGGGTYLSGSTARILDTSFTMCSTEQGGGGMHLSGAWWIHNHSVGHVLHLVLCHLWRRWHACNFLIHPQPSGVKPLGRKRKGNGVILGHITGGGGGGGCR